MGGRALRAKTPPPAACVPAAACAYGQGSVESAATMVRSLASSEPEEDEELELALALSRGEAVEMIEQGKEEEEIPWTYAETVKGKRD